MRKITYAASATKDLGKLPLAARKRIVAKLERYAETGAGDVQALVGRRELRLRAGDYRVLFTQSSDEVYVISVADRKEAYR